MPQRLQTTVSVARITRRGCTPFRRSAVRWRFRCRPFSNCWSQRKMYQPETSSEMKTKNFMQTSLCLSLNEIQWGHIAQNRFGLGGVGAIGLMQDKTRQKPGQGAASLDCRHQYPFRFDARFWP